MRGFSENTASSRRKTDGVLPYSPNRMIGEGWIERKGRRELNGETTTGYSSRGDDGRWDNTGEADDARNNAENTGDDDRNDDNDSGADDGTRNSGESIEHGPKPADS